MVLNEKVLVSMILKIKNIFVILEVIWKYSCIKIDELVFFEGWYLYVIDCWEFFIVKMVLYKYC